MSAAPFWLCTWPGWAALHFCVGSFFRRRGLLGWTGLGLHFLGLLLTSFFKILLQLAFDFPLAFPLVCLFLLQHKGEDKHCPAKKPCNTGSSSQKKIGIKTRLPGEKIRFFVRKCGRILVQLTLPFFPLALPQCCKDQKPKWLHQNVHLAGDMGWDGQFTGQVQCPGHRPIKIINNPHDDVVDRGAAVVRGELPQKNPWQRTRPGRMSWTAVFRNAFAIIFAFPITVALGV